MKSSVGCVKKGPRVRKRSQTGTSSSIAAIISIPVRACVDKHLATRIPFVIVDMMSISSSRVGGFSVPRVCRVSLNPRPRASSSEAIGQAHLGVHPYLTSKSGCKRTRGICGATVGTTFPIRSRTRDDHQPHQSTVHTVDGQL
jgi:hypothetical protein